MIIYASGDILSADVEAVVNTVNTVGVMGKGLALQFKRRYPDNYDAYRLACKAGEVKLGHMFVTQPTEIDGPRIIVNFPTKGHWKADSRLSDVRDGLVDLVRVIRDNNIKSIAVPPLGAGNGNLNWDDVRPVIVAALEPLTDVRVELFAPVKAHFAVRPGKPVNLTRSRALMLDLMLSYSRQREAMEPWEDARGASHLEVQKLMYFAAKVFPALKLDFVKGNYGPYSDKVRIMLQELEGTYLEGFGDGSDPVTDLVPIRITDMGMEALEGFHDPEIGEQIGQIVNGVVGYIHGFEGPYPLELLSTVRWAVEDTGSTETPAIVQYIRNWNYRKGQLFTPRHIEAALGRVAG